MSLFGVVASCLVDDFGKFQQSLLGLGSSLLGIVEGVFLRHGGSCRVVVSFEPESDGERHTLRDGWEQASTSSFSQSSICEESLWLRL